MTCPFPAGSTILAYLRDSGGDEQELSTEQQRQHILEYCHENNLICLKIYQDSLSGSKTTNRIQFQQCLHTLRHPQPNQQIAGLILWKYSRFARDIDDAQYLIADIRRRGYIIHTLKDNIPDGPIGRLVEAAIHWMNQQYLEDLRTDVKRGQLYIVNQHKAHMGIAPIGYIFQKFTIGNHRDGSPHVISRWVPDPEKAPLVKLAFQLRSQHNSYKQIHDKLHLQALPGNYLRLFTNISYIGHYKYDGNIFENHHEPIIDLELFELVQDLTRKLNQQHPKRHRSHYLLSGLVYCGECSRLFNGSTKTTKYGIYRYYACRTRTEWHNCPTKPVKAEPIEQQIIQDLFTYLQSPQYITAILNAQTDARKLSIDGNIQQQHHLRQIATLDRQIKNIIAAISEHSHSPALINELKNLEEQRLNLIQNPPPNPTPIRTYTEPQLKGYLALLSAKIQKLDPQTLKKILFEFIERIDIYPDHTYTITYTPIPPIYLAPP